MIRFLNVYYPTRTVMLLLCEACIVAGCFLAATWWVLRDHAIDAFQLEGGALKIAAITVVSLILSYYFDLYEPTIVSGRLQISRLPLSCLPLSRLALPSMSSASHCSHLRSSSCAEATSG